MKRLTCRDLGGPCDAEFAADSFEEIGKKSQEHVMEQMQKRDAAHLSAASSMRSATPEQQKAMMAEFKRKFDEAPNV
jgi:predicted small metal-binding protein